MQAKSSASTQKDPKWSIRQAAAEDSASIRRLIYRVGINPMNLDWRRFMVLVDEQGRMVGCGQVKPHRDGSRELASLAVQPEYQRQGAGTQIVLRLLAENPLPLYLTCRASLEPYYEQFGFMRLDEKQMTPYFRRIYGVFLFFKRIFGSKIESLLVMRKTT